MIIGIIAAMDKEIAALREKIKYIEEISIMNQIFYIGIVNEKKVVFTISGIGKVNAAITTTLLIEHFHPQLVINSGIAGGYLSSLKTLDIIVANKVIYSDVDMTSDIIGCFPYGQIEGSPEYFVPKYQLINSNECIFGAIMSGDQFVDDYVKAKELIDKHFSNYDVIAVDMESASISQVCTKYKTDFLIIRSISDIIGKSNGMDYNTFSILASNKSCDIVFEVIKKI